MLFQKGHPSFHTEESKRKISEAHKGKILSKETKEKISLNHSYYWLGKKMSEEHRKKIGDSQKGKRLTEEHKKKISESRLGEKHWGYGKKRPLEIRQKIKDGLRGEKNYLWKGEKVGYFALHSWVQRELGRPDICEHCGRNGLRAKQINWANKSREYKRTLNDWLRLCVPCHREYDKQF